MALGPLSIANFDRYLVADPSVILLEEETSILSSSQSFMSKSTLGVSSLTQSFETNVWYLILFTLIFITIIFSLTNYIWATKSNKSSQVNKRSFSKILIRNSFEYSGNLLKQCKFNFN